MTINSTLVHTAIRSRVTMVAGAGLAAAGLAFGVAARVHAAAPPVGPLPAGPAATVVTHLGELVAVALPNRAAGRSWRLARPFDASVLSEVSEANIGANVVLVFAAHRAGRTTLRFALTRGESAKALEARSFVVRVGRS
jgi:hypothetical protein